MRFRPVPPTVVVVTNTEIWQILEFQLHFCALIVAHFRIHVENIQIIFKNVCEPPLQMTNLAWQRTKLHFLLRTRCTRQGGLITFRLAQEHFIGYLSFIRLGILRRFLDKHWQKCVSHPSENLRFHPSVERPLIVPLSRNVIPVFGDSHYQWEECQPPSMNPPRS
jgi:hypothetical protein